MKNVKLGVGEALYKLKGQPAVFSTAKKVKLKGHERKEDVGEETKNWVNDVRENKKHSVQTLSPM